ncbi:MAG: hypothetical protein IJD72_07130 [Alistipes sp.]|nr:hypothetical protein [Alistipes sp.]
MIKRIIGILASIGVLALVVFAAIGSGSYTSIFPKTKPGIESASGGKETVKLDAAEKKSDDEKSASKNADADSKKSEKADSLKQAAK